MRTFIAIELPEALKSELALARRPLLACDTRVAWVKPSTLHITLRFLGEVDRTALGCVRDSLREPLSEMEAFPIRLAGVGAFPNLRRPRVLWLGAEQGRAELERVAATVEQVVTGCGLPRETKRFSAHVTLGRPRGKSGLEGLRERIRETPIRLASFEATHVTLFESVLQPAGAVHTPLERFRLVENVTSSR